MKILTIAFLILLPGCASQQIDHALSNISADCTRHYAGSLGGGMLGTQTGVISFTIDCQPSGTTTTVSTPASTTTVVTPATHP